MKVIKGICKGIDKFNDILGRIFSVLVLAILAVITISFYIIGNAFADAADPKSHVK